MKNMKRRFVTPCFLFLLMNIHSVFGNNVSEPKIFIKLPGKTISYSRSDLLARKNLEMVEVENDPAYGKKMTYPAVPVASLFEGIEVSKESVLLFECLDGFAAPIPQEKVLNRSPSKAIAYLAIEQQDKKWPTLSASDQSQTAGPFYLIWKMPAEDRVLKEDWPYQLAGFEVKDSLISVFPAIFPDQKLGKLHPVQKGLKVFVQNCLSCHSLNLQGSSNLGPDLNYPKSPIEYYSAANLKTFIRNPQSLRSWSQGKMKGFSQAELPDAELGNLIEYFKHMSKRKVKKGEGTHAPSPQ